MKTIKILVLGILIGFIPTRVYYYDTGYDVGYEKGKNFMYNKYKWMCFDVNKINKIRWWRRLEVIGVADLSVGGMNYKEPFKSKELDYIRSHPEEGLHLEYYQDDWEKEKGVIP